MQDRPDASELLDAIANLLESDVLPALSGPLQHQVRVAGNLARILEREARLAPALDDRERELLADVLGVDANGADTRTLSAGLAERLRTSTDEDLEQRAWPALLEIVRGKLAVNKPGYDTFDFGDEVEIADEVEIGDEVEIADEASRT